MANLNAEIVAALNGLRERAGLSMWALARKMGWDDMKVRRALKPGTNTALEDYEAIAAALGYTLHARLSFVPPATCVGVMRATCETVGACLFPASACLSSPASACNDARPVPSGDRP